MPSAGNDDTYSNPVAPAGEITVDDSKPQRLTNADFRKLLMTPRVPSNTTKETASAATNTTHSRNENVSQTEEGAVDGKSSERKKKKSYYARIKKEEEEFMASLAEKYRDRASERREGKNPDYQGEESSQVGTGAGAYRAVAPDAKSGYDAAERRRRLIQESKFLGGDMEHTHLVKGLDYALLQKVRSEIEMLESEIIAEKTAPNEPQEKKAVPAPADEEEITFRTNMGKRVFNSVFHSQPPDFNELFLPGRLAYAIDLDDVESDIPITVMRSKADMMDIENLQATFTTNDIVIQKLTQILSYLRTGRTSKKQKKKEKGKEPVKGVQEDSIYGEIGDYIPGLSKSEKDKDKDKGKKDRERDKRDSRRDREKDREDKKRSYFTRPPEEDLKAEWKNAEKRLESEWPLQNPEKTDPENPKLPPTAGQRDIKNPKGLTKKSAMEDDYYTECYPGMAEMQDAIDDSDDEADYTKMDLGNKKGPVGRWDFDTPEEYSQYMNQREAMPKAAFQYGVKMADGRKTRRIGGKEKDRNAELNKEWQQIQQILKRRKDDGPGEKRTRYEY